ncbi:hypothetical protein V6N11_077535 [Hibiscus sabdariffa]|uniref:Uncharacterized protein n=1 Tax=Hibiscus sabdariffa TaxID=183260 RepID=A0ABR2TDR1_9ROSI
MGQWAGRVLWLSPLFGVLAYILFITEHFSCSSQQVMVKGFLELLFFHYTSQFESDRLEISRLALQSPYIEFARWSNPAVLKL